jgi:hypothetical protein
VRGGARFERAIRAIATLVLLVAGACAASSEQPLEPLPRTSARSLSTEADAERARLANEALSGIVLVRPGAGLYPSVEDATAARPSSATAPCAEHEPLAFSVVAARVGVVEVAGPLLPGKLEEAGVQMSWGEGVKAPARVALAKLASVLAEDPELFMACTHTPRSAELRVRIHEDAQLTVLSHALPEGADLGCLERVIRERLAWQAGEVGEATITLAGRRLVGGDALLCHEPTRVCRDGGAEDWHLSLKGFVRREDLLPLSTVRVELAQPDGTSVVVLPGLEVDVAGARPRFRGVLSELDVGPEWKDVSLSLARERFASGTLPKAMPTAKEQGTSAATLVDATDHCFAARLRTSSAAARSERPTILLDPRSNGPWIAEGTAVTFEDGRPAGSVRLPFRLRRSSVVPGRGGSSCAALGVLAARVCFELGAK